MTDQTSLRVDLTAPRHTAPHFWRSTGFSPAELLLEPEMRHTLAHVGGVPHRGVEYLRVHYMLDLVAAKSFGDYDWTLLDEALDVIIAHRMRPFFELMGNPSNLFTDFREPAQVHHWHDLVVQLATRYRARYGAAEVAAWYFETWNEPDIWWRLGETEGFNNYYDACSEALRSVDPTLRFGGPGTARTMAPMFKSILAHCDTGTNFFTGETGVRLDFISVHEKGVYINMEDVTPNTLGICQRELTHVAYIRAHHPKFAALPFINNECDPQTGWWYHHTWHATPYFSALAVKVIDQHQRLLAEQHGVNYAMLSNDNGFMGRWGQRTHLAYFGTRQFHSAQRDHQTDLAALASRRADPTPFDMIKKPALSVMELLSQLGTERLAVTGTTLTPDADGLGLIATAHPGTTDRAAFLIYNSVDRIWTSGESSLRLEVAGLSEGNYMIATFRIEEGKGDPFQIWEEQGVPAHPSPMALAEMRLAQEPHLTTEELHISPQNGSHHAALPVLTLRVKLPGLALICIEKKHTAALPVPRAPRITLQKALGERTNALLFWDDVSAGAMMFYDVLWHPTETATPEQINPKPLLSTVFVHNVETASGFYSLRTRDIFGRVSATSAVTAIP